MPRQPSPHRGDGRTRITAPSVDSHLSRIEDALVEIRGTLDVQFKRMAAMQAEIDHLTAKHDL